MYIQFNENGEYGFYNPEIHGIEFCKNECIKISDEFYQYLLDSNGKYIIDVKSVINSVTKDNLTERPIEIIEGEQVPTLEERITALEILELERMFS